MPKTAVNAESRTLSTKAFPPSANDAMMPAMKPNSVMLPIASSVRLRIHSTTTQAAGIAPAIISAGASPSTCLRTMVKAAGRWASARLSWLASCAR